MNDPLGTKGLEALIELRPKEPGYPRRLMRLRAPPDPLWLSGTLPEERTRCVAVVGTRRMTPYGNRVAREVSGGIVSAGAVVVSGLAQGIDSVAHQAALDAGGRSIAVLGEGLLAFEQSGPLKRRRLARAIRERGALVSEYGLDFGAQTWTFPRRNLTIAALADAVVVIEAPVGSGALITADRAIELGRPVFAVPGPLGASTWEGSNRYIAKRKAHLLVSASDVLSPFGLAVPKALPRPVESEAIDRALDLLASGAADADAIAASLGLPVAEATTLIADMLLAGRIAATGDGRFARL